MVQQNAVQSHCTDTVIGPYSDTIGLLTLQSDTYGSDTLAIVFVIPILGTITSVYMCTQYNAQFCICVCPIGMAQ